MFATTNPMGISPAQNSVNHGAVTDEKPGNYGDNNQESW
jgi:hypothetical protein